MLVLILFSGEKGEGKTTLKPLHYKNSPIHRVVTGFIVQGGDFSAGKEVGPYEKFLLNVCYKNTVLKTAPGQTCLSKQFIKQAYKTAYQELKRL